VPGQKRPAPNPPQRLIAHREAELIRHIVFFTVRPDVDVETVRSGLMALGRIPHSRHFEVTVNRKVDLFANEIDIVVYAEFDDQAALDTFKAHPLYGETTRAVRPLRELRFSADVVAMQPETVGS
jgi:hypothetical protein